MIYVKIFRRGQFVRGFSVTGHSNFRPKGPDIVCSAVSALSQTAVGALIEVAGATPHWSMADGLLECRLPSDLDGKVLEDGQLVLATIILGIDNIAQQYPRHVSVSYEEV